MHCVQTRLTLQAYQSGHQDFGRLRAQVPPFFAQDHRDVAHMTQTQAGARRLKRFAAFPPLRSGNSGALVIRMRHMGHKIFARCIFHSLPGKGGHEILCQPTHEERHVPRGSFAQASKAPGGDGGERPPGHLFQGLAPGRDGLHEDEPTEYLLPTSLISDAGVERTPELAGCRKTTKCPRRPVTGWHIARLLCPLLRHQHRGSAQIKVRKLEPWMTG